MSSDDLYKNFVIKLNKDTCLVRLEVFIDCDDEEKTNSLDYILDQTKLYDNVIASLTWENREPTTWLPWVKALREHNSCTLIFDSVY